MQEMHNSVSSLVVDDLALKDYWRKVRVAQFELSHRCTREQKHELCPIRNLRAHFDGFLDSRVIFDVCGQLSTFGNTEADIYLHLYNEPSIDCRTCWIVHKIRHEMKMPNTILFQSNGDGLDENIVRDLIECGVNNIAISTDDDAEFDRWIGIKNRLNRIDMRFRVNKKRHDNRLNVYKGEHLEADPERRKNLWELEAPFRCTAPLSHFLVSAEGNVLLCEMDWKRMYSFGQLPKDDYGEIFAQKQAVYDEIHDKGNKSFLELCSKCSLMFRSW